MIGKKKCGSCRNLDVWECTCTKAYWDTDQASPCKYWRGIKYDRTKQKKKDLFELELEKREDDEFYLEYYEDYHERWYFEDCWDEYRQKQINI